MATAIAVSLKDLIIPTRKQGAPRVAHADIVAKYAEHLKVAGKEWPFPPILVAQQVKKEKPTGKWVVLGGSGRIKAAKEVKWDEPIPALTLEDGKDPYIAAIEDNLKHGAPFNEKERNESFRILAGRKMTVTAIADLWNVHKSTVSRVLNDATTTAGRAARSTAAGTETEAAPVAMATNGKNGKGTQDVPHWLDFFKARYDDIYEYLYTDDEELYADREEFRALVFRLAEALNG